MTWHGGDLFVVGTVPDAAALDAVEGVSAVTTVAPDAVSDRVASADAACVVVAHDPPAVDALPVTDAARTADLDVPIVVRADGDEALAADAVAAGADRYVPVSRGPDALVDAVSDAVAAGERRRERALNVEWLTRLLEHAPMDVYVKDASARHLRSTKTVRFDDVAGETELDYFEDERARTIYEEDLAVLEGETPLEGVLTKYEVSSSDIDEYDAGWIRSWKYPWYDADGDLRGLIGFTQDVTGFRETERELTRKNELLSQFASVVTHDLRNPLNVAAGHLELARETGEASHFDTIDRSLDRMDEIIDDLVRLTRDQDGDADESAVSLADQAHTAWTTVDPGSATLEVTDEAAETVLRAEPGLLQQVFENLFRNAVEHAGPDVTVTVGLTDRGFYVADDGPGLPADVRERINAGEFNAGGLGLNIVRTIADRHDWSLHVGVSDDGGARFVFGDCVLVENTDLDASTRTPAPLDGAAAIGHLADGSHRRDGGSWTVTGQGRNLWREVNEFYFVHGVIEGDADLIARVSELAAGHGSAKAGLMVRAGTDPGDPHGFIGVTRDHGTEALWQVEANGGTQSRSPGDDRAPPVWYRLSRSGDTVTVFASADGEEWDAVDEQALPLGSEAAYGLVVCSHDDESATATFDSAALSAVSWR